MQRNYAYAGLGYELAVLNIADPAHPRQVGYALLPGIVRSISVVGGIAYVAADDAGLRVISLANPAAPTEIGALALTGQARDVAVAGRYAYVAAGKGGLRIVDLAAPAAPVEVGSFRIPGGGPEWSPEGEQVAVSGNYAFLAAGYSGLRVVNITNPAAPVEVYGDPLALLPSLEALAVDVAGHYAYMGDIVDDGPYTFAHLRIMDIASPAKPVKVGDAGTGGAFLHLALAIDGQYAYVSGSSSSMTKDPCEPSGGFLSVVDITNPASPRLIRANNPATPTEGMAIAGKYLYGAAGRAGI